MKTKKKERREKPLFIFRHIQVHTDRPLNVWNQQKRHQMVERYVYVRHTYMCGCACYVQIYPSIYLFIHLSIHILWIYAMYFYVDKRSNHCVCASTPSVSLLLFVFFFVWHQRFSVITSTHSKIKSKQFLHRFDMSKGQYVHIYMSFRLRIFSFLILAV